MKLREIKELLDAEVITKETQLEMDAAKVFACDLMSDVLACVNDEVILLTGLINIQTIRTADMKDIKCVIFVRGKKPAENVIELANEMGIILMSTRHIMFTASGILYGAGIKGAEIN